jgi:hypothetical protein
MVVVEEANRNMKFRYDYVVNNVDLEGWATVEYRNNELGWVSKQFFVPYHKGPEAVKQKIIEKFPHEVFYGRWMKRNVPITKISQAYIRGCVDMDFDDYFYDIQTEVADTLVINEEKDSEV